MTGLLVLAPVLLVALTRAHYGPNVLRARLLGPQGPLELEGQEVALERVEGLVAPHFSVVVRGHTGATVNRTVALPSCLYRGQGEGVQVIHQYCFPGGLATLSITGLNGEIIRSLSFQVLKPKIKGYTEKQIKLLTIENNLLIYSFFGRIHF